MDIPLLMLSIINILLLLKVFDDNSYLNNWLLGFTLSLAVLTKLLYLPIALLIIFSVVLYYILTEHKVYLFKNLLLTFTFLIPIVIWIIFNGISIPWTTLNFYPIVSNPQQVSLSRDKLVVQQCYADTYKIDFNIFYYNDNNLDKISQPVNYLLDNHTGNKNNIDLPISTVWNPGPVLYYLIWLSPLVTIFIIKNTYLLSLKHLFLINTYTKDLKAFKFHLIIIISIIFTLYFLITNTVSYWYLLPILPFISLLGAYLLEKYFNNKQRYLITLAIFIFGVINIVGVLSHVIKIQIPNINNDHYNLYNKVVNISEFFNTTEGLIMDASMHPNQVFLTFVENYDERVFRSNYYFKASQNSNKNKLVELKSQNVKYITFDTYFSNSVTHFGCPVEDRLLMLDFLKEYAKVVYYDNEFGIIYEI